MKKFLLGAAICLATALTSACKSEYESPTNSKVKAAISEWSDGAPLESINDLSCQDLGRGKFYCSFEVIYIGTKPEEMEKCFFSSASELTVHPNSSCY